MFVLDAFSGAGGSARGYALAGATKVVGVDIVDQPQFPYEFVKADALRFLEDYGSEFDFIHASPPCQAHSQLNNIWAYSYDDFIARTRALLIATGKPWVIENVVGAPLRNPIRLCGAMFDLRVYRHRLFESSQPLSEPSHPRHIHRAAYGYIPRGEEFYTVSGHFGDLPGARKAMGIDWMGRKELAQAIPPAYTEFIGRQLF